MHRGFVHIAFAWVFIFIPLWLTLAACGTQSGTPAMPADGAGPLNTPMGTSDQAVLAAMQTQQQNNTDAQAAATAEIARINAQGTLNSANATLSAIQTQNQGDVNLAAAQMAYTAEMVHANAEATLNSAGSTQNAAMTQDSIQQTQIVAVATSSAQALLDQQNKDELAAATQTAVANHISTQTQAAVVAAQWHAEEARLDEEQRRSPITFLWMWCLPAFILLFVAGLIFGGFWHWFKVQQNKQLVLEDRVDRLQAPATKVTHYQDDAGASYLESDMADGRLPRARPDDQIRRWLDEVKGKLLSSARKEQDDKTNN